MRITNFHLRNYHSSCSQFEDKILLDKVPKVSKTINNLPPVFNKLLPFYSDIHNYETASSTTSNSFKPSFQTNSNGRSSNIVSAINSWNKPQNTFSDVMPKS